jgi:hypothetical protein
MTDLAAKRIDPEFRKKTCVIRLATVTLQMLHGSRGTLYEASPPL